MFCHQCGKELRKNARFCSNCGTPAREISGQAVTAGKAGDSITDVMASGVQTVSLTVEEDTKTLISDSKASKATVSIDPDTPAAQTADTSGNPDAPVSHVADTSTGSDAPTAQTAAISIGSDAPAAQAATSSVDPDTPGAQAADTSGNPGAPVSQAATISDDSETSETQAADTSVSSQEPLPQETSDTEAPADLILKKGSVIVTGSELHLNKKYYIRKPGKKTFKKKRDLYTIPLDSILGTSLEHHKYGGRIFLSLLLLVCFVAGVLFSVRYGYDTYNILNTPYRDKELAAQKSIMSIIDTDGAEQLLQYRNDQKENRDNADILSARLEELKALQAQEILAAVYSSDRFDLDDFFNRDMFSRAYHDYLQDLLDAFKSDELLHSWLYPYYETTSEYGGNYFLDTDMWIYNGNGENIFSSGLNSADSLMDGQYDLDLYEHILYTGRIYITGADFLREVLSLPRYTLDGAIFVKAYGGTPDTSAMNVPGWGRSHYEEFWLYGADYYDIATPIWLDYGLPAETFELDWNSLVDEAAYYNAYQKLMDKIAPDLPRYEMASYHADNAAYGGMGCSVNGTEASFSDIVASYAESHPEFIDELMESGIYDKMLTTSVDEEITKTEARLEKLEDEFLDLQEQERELEQILADADIYRGNYALLLADIEQHTQKLTNLLLFFSGCALLCLLGALICLCKFFSFIKRPRHLFVISRHAMEYAFNTRHCPKEQIADLQRRLPGQENNKTEMP